MSQPTIQEIYSPPNGISALDIIFIHGLSDNFSDCWRQQGQKGKVWPLWLNDEFPSASIWSVEYPTSKLKSYIQAPDLSIVTIASSISDYLKVKKIGARPLIFVTHSMGGLIAKAILRSCEGSGNPKKKKIFENCVGVAFIATPHTGSTLGTFLSSLPGVASKNVQDLERASSTVMELYTWYQAKSCANGIKTCALYETVKTKGVMVVDAGSANPGVAECEPVAIVANHSDICKFSNKDDHGYLEIVNFIEEIFSDNDIKTEIEVTVDDLEYYLNSVKKNRKTLSEKLTDGKRSAAEIYEAEQEKERISKLVMRNQNSNTARAKYRQYLSDVLVSFRLHVAPLVRSGANELEVNQAISKQVIAPLLLKSHDNSLFNMADIQGAIYYLTGNCHIEWEPSS